MKRFKRLYILFGVLVVACAATFAVARIEEHKEQIKNSEEIILEIPSDSVESLSWEYEDTSLAFHKEDTWLYDGDENFPVDNEKINNLLEQFQAFGVSFIIDDVEDLAQYGLDDPVCSICFATADTSYEVLLGDFSTMDSERYISIGDGKVYLVPNDPLDYFNATLSEVIDHDDAPVFDTVEKIQFTGEETYDIVYEENSTDTYCAEDIYFTQREGEIQPLDTSQVDTYLSSLKSLDLTNYVTYNVTEEELQSYGLDAPELIITIDYTTEDEDGGKISGTYTLNVSRDPEEKEAGESQEADGNESVEEEETFMAYARVGESHIVYQITSAEYENLMAASYDDLRHEEVLSAAFEDITQIDFTLEGQTYTVTPKVLDKDSVEDETTWLYQGEEFDVTNLRNGIETLNANSFTSETAAGKEEIRYTVHLDNENHPQVEIVLYRYDGSNCIAEVDGKTVSLVLRSYVVDLIEAVNAVVLN